MPREKIVLPLLLGAFFAVVGGCQRRESAQAPEEQQQPQERPAAPGAEGGAERERAPVAGREETALVVVDETNRQHRVSDQALIRQVEEKLKAANLNPGEVDGRVDSQFSQALTSFQKNNGLPTTGYLDPQTAKALGVDWEQARRAIQAHEPSAPGQPTTKMPGEAGEAGQQPGQQQPGQQPGQPSGTEAQPQ